MVASTVAAARAVAAIPAAEPVKGCLPGWAEIWVLPATVTGAWADFVAVVEEMRVDGEREVAMVTGGGGGGGGGLVAVCFCKLKMFFSYLILFANYDVILG